MFRIRKFLMSQMKDHCPLCHSEKIEMWANLDNYPVAKCSDCTFVFTKNINFDELTKLYQKENYYTEQGGSGFHVTDSNTDSFDSTGDDYFKTYRLQPASNLLQNQKTIRYLDIGCSAGHMLQIAKNMGWQAKGIEISPVAVEFGRKRGLDITQSSVDEYNFSKNSFDLISMFHVLEHVFHPREELKKIKTALSPNGFLIIEVPNIASLPAKMRKSSWKGLLVPYHLWHFNKSTLPKLLDEVGYEVIINKTPYHPCTFAEVYPIHHLPGKIFKLFKPSSPIKDVKDEMNTSGVPLTKSVVGKRKILNRLVIGGYWVFDQIMAVLGLGPYLYIVARPRN